MKYGIMSMVELTIKSASHVCWSTPSSSNAQRKGTTEDGQRVRLCPEPYTYASNQPMERLLACRGAASQSCRPTRCPCAPHLAHPLPVSKRDTEVSASDAMPPRSGVSGDFPGPSPLLTDSHPGLQPEAHGGTSHDWWREHTVVVSAHVQLPVLMRHSKARGTHHRVR